MFAKQNLMFWFTASRPHSFIQSAMPFALGSLLGASTLLYSGANLAAIGLSIILALIGIVGITCAHAGMNLFDDYFDMKKGAVEEREKLSDGGFRARMGKCKYLHDGAVSLDDTKRVATLFVVVALACALIIFAVRGWEILLFAGITLILGLSYAGPPLRLSYHGFGELVIGILFGPVLVTAASFVVCGQLTMLALFSSIPIGLLVANIVHMHAVMDFGPDKAAKRKTFAILLGSEHAGIAANVTFVILAQATILVGIAIGFLPLFASLIVLTYPLSIVFIRQARSYVKKEKDEASFQPKRWMGRFDNWEKYQKDGLDWFMSRWLLARNLVTQVTVVLAIAAFTPWHVPWA